MLCVHSMLKLPNHAHTSNEQVINLSHIAERKPWIGVVLHHRWHRAAPSTKSVSPVQNLAWSVWHVQIRCRL